MNKSKRWIILGVCGVVAASSAAWGIGARGANGEAIVRRSDVVRTVVAPGIVESATDEIALGFDAFGRIAELSVDEGSRVEAGQVLGRLDDRLARARVARAEAGVAAAVAQAEMVLHGPRPEEIRAAEAEASVASIEAENRALSRARAEQLSTANAVAGAELDGARHAAQAARAAARAAEARLSLLLKGTRVEERRRALAAVAAARAELEEARTLLDNASLKAPISGVIVRRRVELGEQVTTMPPTVALTLADTDHLVLRTEIDESDVARVGVGQRGYATAAAFGSRHFEGRVVQIARTLGRKNTVTDDPRERVDTRVLEVLFEVEEPAGLPLGMRLDVHIEARAQHGVLTIPLSAVDESGHVTVVSGDGRSTRRVRLGVDDGVIVEVISGLSDGEHVAVRGALSRN